LTRIIEIEIKCNYTETKMEPSEKLSVCGPQWRNVFKAWIPCGLFTASWNLSYQSSGERFIYDHAVALYELQGSCRETTFTHEPAK